MNKYLIFIFITTACFSQFKPERQRQVEALLNAPCCFGGVLSEHDSPLSNKMKEIIAKLISEDFVVDEVRLELNNLVTEFKIPVSSALTNNINSILQSPMSDSEIVDLFVLIFGERVRSTPGQSGLDKLAWGMPIVFIIFGLFLITIILKKFSNERELLHENKLTDKELQKIEDQFTNEMTQNEK